MPEEINRLVTDRLSDLLFTTERAAIDNLLKEGVSPETVTFVGNVMIDTLHACLERAAPAKTTLEEIGAAPDIVADALKNGFGFVTLHRPSNVDDPGKLGGLLKALATIAERLPLVFPQHPRTRAVIESAGLARLLNGSKIIVAPPVSYLQAIGLMRCVEIGHHRQRRRAGGNHGHGGSLPDGAGKHGTTDHDRRRHEHPYRNFSRRSHRRRRGRSRERRQKGSHTGSLGRQGRAADRRRDRSAIRANVSMAAT